MSDESYTLDDFVGDLREISARTRDDREIIAKVRPLARRLALEKSWLKPEHYQCNEEQGFGVHLLHEEPDHTLAVFAVSWLPGRGAPPHNHGNSRNGPRKLSQKERSLPWSPTTSTV